MCTKVSELKLSQFFITETAVQLFCQTIPERLKKVSNAKIDPQTKKNKLSQPEMQNKKDT